MLTKMFKGRKKLLFVTMVNARISLLNEYKVRAEIKQNERQFDFC
jgi:hypothetical protein